LVGIAPIVGVGGGEDGGVELPQDRAAPPRRMAAERETQIFIRGCPFGLDRGSAGPAILLAQISDRLTMVVLADDGAGEARLEMPCGQGTLETHVLNRRP
jgi:hypothetical protein